MPIRITGMNSGLDTESIISELVKAQKSKVETVKKKQTSHQWKQEAWKELNTKVGKLFNSLNAIRFSGDWSKKVTDVSNSSVVSVTTSDSAMNAAQELKVNELATTAYMTGGKVSTTSGGKADYSTKLSDLGYTGGDSVIKLKVGSKETEIAITGDTTIGDITEKIESAGLGVRFDAENGRFHIAAQQNGSSSDFSFSSETTGGETALAKLGLLDKDKLTALGMTEDEIEAASAHKVAGKDAEIVLNGVKYTSTNNTFNINGLTITAKAKSTEAVTLTTKRDTDGIYDMAKNFLKEYNSLIREMDKLYNAESAKGYDPLTEDEKAEMSDSEIEKWEAKIKDSILRRDSNLSTLSTAMKTIMLQGATVNGEKMYLSSFGIETLGYWEAEENEKSVFHIQGDEDFPSVSTKDNKLKAMVESDPDKVIDFFSQLAMNMYKELDSQSRGIDGIRSFGKFYDDKKMEEEYNNYTSKITKLETKLTAMEDNWYKKFAAMETAMAKMQSNQNALSSLLGG